MPRRDSYETTSPNNSGYLFDFFYGPPFKKIPVASFLDLTSRALLTRQFLSLVPEEAWQLLSKKRSRRKMKMALTSIKCTELDHFIGTYRRTKNSERLRIQIAKNVQALLFLYVPQNVKAIRELFEGEYSLRSALGSRSITVSVADYIRNSAWKILDYIEEFYQSNLFKSTILFAMNCHSIQMRPHKQKVFPEAFAGSPIRIFQKVIVPMKNESLQELTVDLDLGSESAYFYLIILKDCTKLHTLSCVIYDTKQVSNIMKQGSFLKSLTLKGNRKNLMSGNDFRAAFFEERDEQPFYGIPVTKFNYAQYLELTFIHLIDAFQELELQDEFLWLILTVASNINVAMSNGKPICFPTRNTRSYFNWALNKFYPGWQQSGVDSQNSPLRETEDCSTLQRKEESGTCSSAYHTGTSNYSSATPGSSSKQSCSTPEQSNTGPITCVPSKELLDSFSGQPNSALDLQPVHSDSERLCDSGAGISDLELRISRRDLISSDSEADCSNYQDNLGFDDTLPDSREGPKTSEILPKQSGSAALEKPLGPALPRIFVWLKKISVNDDTIDFFTGDFLNEIKCGLRLLGLNSLHLEPLSPNSCKKLYWFLNRWEIESLSVHFIKCCESDMWFETVFIALPPLISQYGTLIQNLTLIVTDVVEINSVCKILSKCSLLTEFHLQMEDTKTLLLNDSEEVLYDWPTLKNLRVFEYKASQVTSYPALSSRLISLIINLSPKIRRMEIFEVTKSFEELQLRIHRENIQLTRLETLCLYNYHLEENLKMFDEVEPYVKDVKSFLALFPSVKCLYLTENKEIMKQLRKDFLYNEVSIQAKYRERITPIKRISRSFKL